MGKGAIPRYVGTADGEKTDKLLFRTEHESIKTRNPVGGPGAVYLFTWSSVNLRKHVHKDFGQIFLTTAKNVPYNLITAVFWKRLQQETSKNLKKSKSYLSVRVCVCMCEHYTVPSQMSRGWENKGVTSSQWNLPSCVPILGIMRPGWKWAHWASNNRRCDMAGKEKWWANNTKVVAPGSKLVGRLFPRRPSSGEQSPKGPSLWGWTLRITITDEFYVSYVRLPLSTFSVEMQPPVKGLRKSKLFHGA